MIQMKKQNQAKGMKVYYLMCKKTKKVKEEASNDASSDTTDSTDSVQEAA